MSDYMNNAAWRASDDVEPIRFFRCGAPGCDRLVSGIYCHEHKGRVALNEPAPFHEGETVAFSYRGTVKSGIVEKVKRVSAIVLIEVGTGARTKQKLVRVDFVDLRKVSHAVQTRTDAEEQHVPDGGSA